MLPALLAAAVPAAIEGVSSLIGGHVANKANAAQAKAQMDFQERMSGSAYQRATADMRMAGINPMLAYMQGGASSPSGAAADMSDVISPAVSSAKQGARLALELKNLQLDNVVKRQEAASLFTSTLKTGLEHDLVRAQTRNWDAATAKTLAEIPGVKFGSQAAGYNLERSRAVGTVSKYFTGGLDAIEGLGRKAVDFLFDSGERYVGPKPTFGKARARY